MGVGVGVEVLPKRNEKIEAPDVGVGVDVSTIWRVVGVGVRITVGVGVVERVGVGVGVRNMVGVGVGVEVFPKRNEKIEPEVGVGVLVFVG